MLAVPDTTTAVRKEPGSRDYTYLWQEAFFFFLNLGEHSVVLKLQSREGEIESVCFIISAKSGLSCWVKNSCGFFLLV